MRVLDLEPLSHPQLLLSNTHTHILCINISYCSTFKSIQNQILCHQPIISPGLLQQPNCLLALPLGPRQAHLDTAGQMNLLHLSHSVTSLLKTSPWLCLSRKASVMACDLALSPPDVSNPDSPPQRPRSSPASLLAVSRTLQACSDFSVQKAFPHSSLLQV